MFVEWKKKFAGSRIRGAKIQAWELHASAHLTLEKQKAWTVSRQTSTIRSPGIFIVQILFYHQLPGPVCTMVVIYWYREILLIHCTPSGNISVQGSICYYCVRGMVIAKALVTTPPFLPANTYKTSTYWEKKDKREEREVVDVPVSAGGGIVELYPEKGTQR